MSFGLKAINEIHINHPICSACHHKWTPEHAESKCGSQMRSLRGQLICAVIGDVRNMEDLLRQIAEGWYRQRFSHKQVERQAKLQLKLLKSQRLMRDGKDGEALELYWNNDDVSLPEQWSTMDIPVIPKSLDYFLD